MHLAYRHLENILSSRNLVNMNHNVFDTCITYREGKKMYFDVLVPVPLGKEAAQMYALEWLKSISVNTKLIASSKIHFCHNAITKPHIEDVINQQGYAIIKSKGCPGYHC